MVTVAEAAGDPRYEINAAAPLPGEVLPLAEEERAAEDQRRWRDFHEPTAQAIINVFDPDSAKPLTAKRTSLERLARELVVDVESARAGALNSRNVDDAAIAFRRLADRVITTETGQPAR